MIINSPIGQDRRWEYYQALNILTNKIGLNSNEIQCLNFVNDNINNPYVTDDQIYYAICCIFNSVNDRMVAAEYLNEMELKFLAETIIPLRVVAPENYNLYTPLEFTENEMKNLNNGKRNIDFDKDPRDLYLGRKNKRSSRIADEAKKRTKVKLNNESLMSKERSYNFDDLIVILDKRYVDENEFADVLEASTDIHYNTPILDSKRIHKFSYKSLIMYLVSYSKFILDPFTRSRMANDFLYQYIGNPNSNYGYSLDDDPKYIDFGRIREKEKPNVDNIIQQTNNNYQHKTSPPQASPINDVVMDKMRQIHNNFIQASGGAVL